MRQVYVTLTGSIFLKNVELVGFFFLNLFVPLFLFDYRQTDELTDIHLLHSFFCSIIKVLASGSYWCLGKYSLNIQYKSYSNPGLSLIVSLELSELCYCYCYCSCIMWTLLICRLNRNLFFSYHWSPFTSNIIYINHCFFTEIACTRLLLITPWTYVSFVILSMQWRTVPHAICCSRHSVSSFHVWALWTCPNDWNALWSSMYHKMITSCYLISCDHSK